MEPTNFEYSTIPQRKAFSEGRRVFERPRPNRISELAAIHPDGGETWVFRGDLTGTIHDSEIGLRRLYPGCLISRRG